MEISQVSESQVSENRAREAGERGEMLRGRGVRGVTAAAVLLAAGALNLTAEEPAEAVSGTHWDRLARCESGGNWGIETGNGFSGGLQFTHATWHSYGGGAYANRASRATREQQIQVAERVLARQGWGAWPACSASLGLAGLARSSAPHTLPKREKAQPHRNRMHRSQHQEKPYKNERHRPVSGASGSVVVNDGDTLCGIATRHGKIWQELYRQNRQVIGGDPNLIFPGIRLHL
ncbi:LysM peptidoglycan-binding domain-containing protein [Streptomyces sp. GS7]|uniref:LysM peptidoglycan-binding domain-containing protein n=1 Tax=Streptomyces sp. GS7 TaxID=2692234 RepID=UPI00131831CC|nr:transglycosylase family protein [Streptomyces sp. GS7]QHC24398.1 peptidoglycan-binding protein [Streptomyces sp. GS7]